jgi:hypothetical protein
MASEADEPVSSSAPKLKEGHLNRNIYGTNGYQRVADNTAVKNYGHSGPEVMSFLVAAYLLSGQPVKMERRDNELLMKQGWALIRI